MKETFADYIQKPYSLSFEQMARLHEELLAEIDNDPDTIELFEDLIDAATKYADIRAKWVRMSREEKMDTDSLRTSRHNAVIIQFNMLARFLRMRGKAAAWRDELGDENENKYYRKTIGDFGCYIVFVNSICAR